MQITTYNTSSDVRTRRAVRDVVALAETGVDVMALQEMSNPDRRRRLRDRLVSCGGCRFEAFMPGNAVSAGMPILYRKKRFELLKSGSKLVVEATRVGGRGAGPPVLRARYVNWVRLKDRRSGRAFVVLNNHAVPSVQTHGGPNRKMGKRLEMYRKHMRGLQQLVRRFSSGGGKVFVAGDFNVNYRGDRRTRSSIFPYQRMSSVGLRASFTELGEPRRGTHVYGGNTRRLIDYVYFRPRPAVRAADQHVLGGYSSDHRPLVVDFSVRVRR